MKENRLATSTRSHILEAAGKIFAERGFRNATVREICGQAGVNVAAINYHFGGKEGLYTAVLKHWREVAYQKYPPDLGTDESSSPEDRLRAFIRSFVYRILKEGPPSWFGKLWVREFVEPTGALDIMIEEQILPSFQTLASIVRELLGPKADKKSVDLCTMSIVGQCLYFRNATPVIARLRKKDHFTSAEINAIAEHIFRFSLAALREDPLQGDKKAGS